MKRVTLLLMVGLVAAFAFAAQPASASVPYAVGDVFAGIGNGNIKQFSPTGTLKNTLNTQSGSLEDTGMCFDASGNLYSTNFEANDMTKFDNAGNVLTHPFGSGFNRDPESCVRDTSGHIYTGQADVSADILKFNTSGTLLATFNPATGPRGTDWIDLASDQCTIFYTSEGTTVRRFNVCTNTQGTDFATGLPGPAAYALRLLPGGGALVADTNQVVRLNSSGIVVQTYPASTYGSSFLFALNLDPDGTTFWTADISSGLITRINIATGAQVTQFSSQQQVDTAGLAIFGEKTQGGGGPGPPASLTLAPKTATNPVDSQHCVTATVKDASGTPTPNITVRFSVTGSVNTSGSRITNANGRARFCYQGPALPGSDVISAYADSDKDHTQDTGEPSDTAAKVWTLPSGTALCVVKITNGGWIVANNGDRASFGGVAKESSALVASGNEEYQDHGPAQPMNVKSLVVQAITCNANRTQGTIFGTATIDGSGVHNFRIDVQDNGEPGTGLDHYRMRLDTGYDSGDHRLKGGNVQIH
jgi:hypothetical protein